MNTMEQEITARLNDAAWSGTIAHAVHRRIRRRRAIVLSAAAFILILGASALLMWPGRRETQPLGNDFITSQIRGTAGTDTLMTTDPAMDAILVSFE